MNQNDKIWSYEFEKNKSIKAGQLLLSEPFMHDENFRRTVVLICEHTEENGTVGLILNKPVDLRLQDIVENGPTYIGKLFLGGPVGTDSLQYLHSLGNEIEESIEIAEGLYWGGNFEQIKTLLHKGTLNNTNIRFYIGYSGWSTGQLNDELKDNSWIISPAKASHIFEKSYTILWKQVMKEMGGIYSTMAGYPENPTLN